MIVKNDYDECITNLACSIRKYFGLKCEHPTLPYVDEILKEKAPNNVLVMLFDGMGSRILDRTLESDSFFRKNKYKEITSVFPATTTAATTSIRTGLNPVEHGWLGWNVYIEPIDKTITLFKNVEKGKNEICDEFLAVKNKLVTETIADEIRAKEKFLAKEFFPFAVENATTYKNLDDGLSKVLEEIKKDGKKYLYFYNDEPDFTMHDFGPDSEEAKKLIRERNDKAEELCQKLTDTLVIIVADHGHLKVENIFLKNYPTITKMLERTTSIEQRAVSFKIKDEFKDAFKLEFDNLFGEWFSLYTKEDVINSRLFGTGKQNELFESALGDFIAIGESNKCLITDGDDVFASHHAGYTDDEVYIPLIIIDKI